jgi:sulfate transport system ATP-binding protein
MSIEIRHISKHFGRFQALHEVDLSIDAGELVALLGPSGCGKTTLIRIIAGLESPDRGPILFNGADATGTHVRDRQVGFVFQHYALFRHMTVFENVAFGLRIKPRGQRPSTAQIRATVHELLKRVQLEGLSERHPGQLSGGQRQRVALARALAVEPRVLLLDEPFGALDAKVRKALRRWLRQLLNDLKVTGIFVTHDQDEALEVADRVVVMNRGRIEQTGTPQQVWDQPATPFVYGFLGDVNRFSGQAQAGRLEIDGLSLPAPSHPGVQPAAAQAFVRPHELTVQRPGPGVQGIEVRLERALLTGPLVRLELARLSQAKRADGDGLIEAQLSREQYEQLGLQAGDMLTVTAHKAGVFPDVAS